MDEILHLYCVQCDKDVRPQKRKELYAALSRFLGREYHTGELNSLCECDKVINYYLNNYGTIKD